MVVLLFDLLNEFASTQAESLDLLFESVVLLPQEQHERYRCGEHCDAGRRKNPSGQTVFFVRPIIVRVPARRGRLECRVFLLFRPITASVGTDYLTIRNLGTIATYPPLASHATSPSLDRSMVFTFVAILLAVTRHYGDYL